MKRLSYRLFYCVVEDHQGVIFVSSFGGRNVAEERRYAATVCRKVYHVGRDYDAACRVANEVRNQKAAETA